MNRGCTTSLQSENEQVCNGDIQAHGKSKPHFHLGKSWPLSLTQKFILSSIFSEHRVLHCEYYSPFLKEKGKPANSSKKSCCPVFNLFLLRECSYSPFHFNDRIIAETQVECCTSS